MGLTDWGSYQKFGFVVFTNFVDIKENKVHANHLMLGVKDSDCLPEFASIAKCYFHPAGSLSVMV